MILAFQNAKFKILPFQNPEFKILADLRILEGRNVEVRQNVEFKIWKRKTL